MKIAMIISSVVSILPLMSVMICSLWLKSRQPGSINFHMNCGIAGIVFSAVTLILLAITLRSTKKGN